MDYCVQYVLNVIKYSMEQYTVVYVYCVGCRWTTETAEYYVGNTIV